MNSPRSNPDGSVVLARNLSMVYPNGAGDIEVLRGVSLSLFPGEMLAIMGPSGSGKSTLLYILGLLLRPTGGSYWLAGQDVLALDRAGQALCRRERLGFVFQTCDLLENSTVYENLEFPLIYAGVPPRERRERILAALEQVNLGHRLRHAANRLSGGERQRVAVARALAVDPEILFMDEPFGALDAMTRLKMEEELTRIWLDKRKTIVFVTHDIDEAIYLADRVAVMTPNPGRIKRVVEIPLGRPRDRTSYDFLKIKTEIYGEFELASRPPFVYQI